MPAIAQTRDLTGQYLGYDRDVDSFRPLGGATFTPGSVVGLVDQASMVYPDEATIQPTPTAAIQGLLMGIVAETWPGFSGSIAPANYTAASQFGLARGTQEVDIVLRGFHPAVLVDQSGTGAVTLVNQQAMTSSRASVGYAQGVSNTAGYSNLGIACVAMLPASGFGSSLTAAALAQAAATWTLTGTPAVGDTITFTVAAPYTTAQPGVAKTVSYVTGPLTSGQAASVTTAAAAVVSNLNAQPGFSTYFIASSAAGVITITVNALQSPWLVTTANSNGGVASQYTFSLSGMIANQASSGLTYSVSSTGGTVATLTTQFTGGTGYKGVIPAYVVPS